MKYLFIALLLTSFTAIAQEISQAEFQEALKFHRQQAVDGDATSMFFLSEAYRNGWGVAKDKQASDSWLKRSLEKSNPFAFHEMARRHLLGDGAAQDTKLATEFVDKAVAVGYIEPAVFLGGQLLGVHDNKSMRDIEQAKKYLTIAAKQQHPEALFYLGLVQQRLLDPAIDSSNDKYLDKAVEYYQSAAKMGHIFAAGNLGVIFQDQYYPRRNLQKSYFWLRVARSTGKNNWDAEYFSVESKLSSVQRDNVRMEVDKFIAALEAQAAQ